MSIDPARPRAHHACHEPLVAAETIFQIAKLRTDPCMILVVVLYQLCELAGMTQIMSRSFRHTAIAGIAIAKSEKSDKQDANRRLRFFVHVALRRGDDLMPELREVSDVWTWAKDGKRCWPGFTLWEHRNR
jgi:hypothetical protein